MTTPGSPPSGNSVGPSVPPTHTGDRDPAKTGKTSTQQSVSPHPAETSIPRDGDSVRSSGLPENVQPASAPGSTVSPNRSGGGPEEIRKSLNKLLHDQEPLAQSLKQKEEMRYIDATAFALEEMQKKMEDKWDLPEEKVVKAFNKASKEIIKQLKKDKLDDVKVTFNLPGGERVRLIPPELEGLDLPLSDLRSWVGKSQDLVKELKAKHQQELKAKHQSEDVEESIKQKISSGTESFDRLLHQLSQSGGSSEQEIQGFQDQFELIKHPIIHLEFKGVSVESQGRPRNTSTPKPAGPLPSHVTTNDPEHEPVVSEDGDSAFGEGEILSPEDDHKKKTERARQQALDALKSNVDAHAKESADTSHIAPEDTVNQWGRVQEQIRGFLPPRFENDEDADSGVDIPVAPWTGPQRSNMPPGALPERADEASPRSNAGDQAGESGRRVSFEDDDSVSSLSTQSLTMFRVKNDDGLGLYRALFAYHTGDRGWEYDSEAEVRAMMRDEAIAQPIKLAIEKAANEYLDLDSYNTAQRTIVQRMEDLDKEGRLVEEIFDKAIVNGKFSDRTFSHLPEVLGVTDLMTSDRNDPYAFEMRTLSKLIIDELPAALNVPVSSNDGQPGFRRLNEGFGVVLGADGFDDDEDDVSTVSSPLLRTDLPEDVIPDFQPATTGEDRVETPSSVSDQGQRGLVSELSIAEGLNSTHPLQEMSEQEIRLFTEYNLWEHLHPHEIHMIERVPFYSGVNGLIPGGSSKAEPADGLEPSTTSTKWKKLPNFGELCQRYLVAQELPIPDVAEEESPAVSPGPSPVVSSGQSPVMPPQPLGAGEVLNEDGVGLFRALFAYQTRDGSWKSAGQEDIRARILEEETSESIKAAIGKAVEGYPLLGLTDRVNPVITQKLRETDGKRVLVEQIFDNAIASGEFSGQAFTGLAEVLGITDTPNADSNGVFTTGVGNLSLEIIRKLADELQVPRSEDNGLQRQGDDFRLVVDSDYWESEENVDSPVVIRPLPTETSPSSPGTIPSPREASPQSPNMDMGATLNSESGSPVLQPLTGRDSVEEPDDTSSLPPARDEVEVMSPAEDDTIPESVEADSVRAGKDNQPPPPPPIEGLEEFLRSRKK